MAHVKSTTHSPRETTTRSTVRRGNINRFDAVWCIAYAHSVAFAAFVNVLLSALIFLAIFQCPQAKLRAFYFM